MEDLLYFRKYSPAFIWHTSYGE